MASPQTENGYIRIANELFEKMGCFDFLGSEFRILICILRKTYGFNKKEDWISLTQFEIFTGLSRPTVVKVIKNLTENRVIIKNKGKISLNKNWENWGSKAGLTSKAVLTRTSKHRLTDASKAGLTHKRQYQKTKDISASTKVEDAKITTNNKKMRNSFKYNENKHSDTFEDSIDIETGEFNKPKGPKRQKAINSIKDYFTAQCERYLKIKPVLLIKHNIIIAQLFKKGMKPTEIAAVIDWVFNTEKDRTKLIHLEYCVSAYMINSFKISK